MKKLDLLVSLLPFLMRRISPVCLVLILFVSTLAPAYDVTGVLVIRGQKAGASFDRIIPLLVLEPAEQVRLEFFTFREPLAGEKVAWTPLQFTRADGTLDYSMIPQTRLSGNDDILNRRTMDASLDFEHFYFGTDAGTKWNVLIYAVRVSRQDEAPEKGTTYYSSALTLSSDINKSLEETQRLNTLVIVPPLMPEVPGLYAPVNAGTPEKPWEIDLPVVAMPVATDLPPQTAASILATTLEAEEIDKKKSKFIFHVVDPLAKKVPPKRVTIHFFSNRPGYSFYKRTDPWYTYFKFNAGRKDNYDASVGVAGKTEINVPGADRVTGALSIKKGLPGSWGDETFTLTNLARIYNKRPPASPGADPRDEMINELWKQDLSIFMHGFNVEFDEALIRAAQLKVDMGLEGPMLALDWPSRGLTAAYSEDRNLVENSINLRKTFSEFLRKLTMEDRAAGRFIEERGKRNLLCHSMGNEVLNQTIKELEVDSGLTRNMFNHLVFAAPDVTIGEFERMIERLRRFEAAKRLTLYYSRKDLAVNASRFVNFISLNSLWHPSQILEFLKGRAGVTPRFYEGVDIINTDLVNSSLGSMFSDFWHGYFGSSDKVVADIESLFRYDMAPILRGATLSPEKRSFGSTSHYVINP